VPGTPPWHLLCIGPKDDRHGEPNLAYHALRVKDFSYVEYATGERKLYYLGRDPYQLLNIYQSDDQNFVSSLTARLAALKQCAGATCRSAENATLPTVR